MYILDKGFLSRLKRVMAHMRNRNVWLIVSSGLATSDRRCVLIWIQLCCSLSGGSKTSTQHSLRFVVAGFVSGGPLVWFIERRSGKVQAHLVAIIGMLWERERAQTGYGLRNED